MNTKAEEIAPLHLQTAILQRRKDVLAEVKKEIKMFVAPPFPVINIDPWELSRTVFEI
jgi:hypothetical protein